ncbi:MAG: glucosidase [Cyanobacteria bacterium J06633_2]
MTPEHQRIHDNAERTTYWTRWGPYLSERQWGTVREDYSPHGGAWDYFPHDHARSRAYRWGEDGILGIADSHQRLCFAIALWNGRDPILKERIYGLTGTQGNHGEDVKDYYFYLESSPTHSYMKGLYKYPHAEFPYAQLLDENQRRGRGGMEYELLDTGVFNESRYYDVFVEYAKADVDDILIQISVANRGPEAQTLHLLPTLWFRNTWAWGRDSRKPVIKVAETRDTYTVLETQHFDLGDRWLYYESSMGDRTPVPALFTDNETNFERLYNTENDSPYAKDGIHNAVIHDNDAAINPEQTGTKASPHYVLNLAPGETRVVKLRLSDQSQLGDPLGADFDHVMHARREENEAFYEAITPGSLTADLKNIQRQAFAGLMWTKQCYQYVVEDWIEGDPAMPDPPDSRKRNYQWPHLHADDVISMPDKWEYPWFAAWDLAFHCIPLAMIDPEFAKNQLDIMTREWYMHPNGQLPAYEWAFGDVNPPVHAWATWRVYKIEQKQKGKGDRQFLERVFQKLLLNFTWWVNRKDAEGNNLFEGGFLGLDNIGVFDRSAPLPTGGHIEQADGTSWMGMFCLNMLTISLELAQENPVYEDMATKFFEHFLYIADAMNHIGGDGSRLWDDEDGFFYDVLNLPDGSKVPLKIRSTVGLIPLFAITILEPEVLDKLPAFKKRLEWFIDNRYDLKRNVACMQTTGQKARRLLALTYLSPHEFVASDRFRRILEKLLDENEFLSEYGIRALSRYHKENPYVFHANGEDYRVDYEPAESSTGLFGGNSNWRGPIWFPTNYLLIESIQKFHHYAGDDFKVECPTGSGNWMTLWEVASELSRRLMSIFQNGTGQRPVYGGIDMFQSDPHWKDLILFYEYFHGDNGAGVGANHQTGWTGLVAKLIQQYCQYNP